MLTSGGSSRFEEGLSDSRPEPSELVALDEYACYGSLFAFS